jgi:hypothetical protein
MTPAAFVKAFTIGNSEYVASAGASSIFVQIIFDFVSAIGLLYPNKFVKFARQLTTGYAALNCELQSSIE